MRQRNAANVAAEYARREGVSKTGELVDLGVKAGVVEKSGAWFSFDSQRLGQGRENVKLFLKQNPDAAEKSAMHNPEDAAHREHECTCARCAIGGEQFANMSVASRQTLSPTERFASGIIRLREVRGLPAHRSCPVKGRRCACCQRITHGFEFAVRDRNRLHTRCKGDCHFRSVGRRQFLEFCDFSAEIFKRTGALVSRP